MALHYVILFFPPTSILDSFNVNGILVGYFKSVQVDHTDNIVTASAGAVAL